MTAPLVDIEETQDVEVVDAHGYATIKTLAESGTNYCYHDESVLCGVDGVATEVEWRTAFRELLDLRADWHQRYGRDLGLFLQPDADALCLRAPADIAAHVRDTAHRVEAQIAKEAGRLARCFNDEFPAVIKLSSEWSGSAYNDLPYADDTDAKLDLFVSWSVFHDAIQAALDEIEIGLTAGDVKRERENLGLSQAQLARQFGVDVMTISRWERGERAITAPGAVALALAYLHTIATADVDHG